MSSNPNPSSSSSSTYNQLVPKLTGANYATWKTKMEMLLIRAGLWSIVSQRKLRPTPTTASGSASSSRTRSNTAGPSSDDNDTAVQKWDENAERATAEIFLYLDERVERRVLKIRNPVELWGKLQTFYERKGFSSRFYLWQKLFTLKLADYRKRDEGNTIELYLDAFRSHVQQLRSSGAPVSNEIEASALLNGLDDGYESFIVSTTQSIRQTADDEIDVEQLVSQLCDEDRRRTSGQTSTEIGDPNTGSALNAHGKRRYPSQSDKPRPTCNHCDRDGHRQDDCWELHPEKKPDRRSKRPKHGNSLLAHGIAEYECDLL